MTGPACRGQQSFQEEPTCSLPRNMPMTFCHIERFQYVAMLPMRCMPCCVRLRKAWIRLSRGRWRIGDNDRSGVVPIRGIGPTSAEITPTSMQLPSLVNQPRKEHHPQSHQKFQTSSCVYQPPGVIHRTALQDPLRLMIYRALRPSAPFRTIASHIYCRRCRRGCGSLLYNGRLV